MNYIILIAIVFAIYTCIKKGNEKLNEDEILKIEHEHAEVLEISTHDRSYQEFSHTTGHNSSEVTVTNVKHIKQEVWLKNTDTGHEHRLIFTNCDVELRKGQDIDVFYVGGCVDYIRNNTAGGTIQHLRTTCQPGSYGFFLGVMHFFISFVIAIPVLGLVAILYEIAGLIKEKQKILKKIIWIDLAAVVVFSLTPLVMYANHYSGLAPYLISAITLGIIKVVTMTNMLKITNNIHRHYMSYIAAH